MSNNRKCVDIATSVSSSSYYFLLCGSKYLYIWHFFKYLYIFFFNSKKIKNTYVFFLHFKIVFIKSFQLESTCLHAFVYRVARALTTSLIKFLITSERTHPAPGARGSASSPGYAPGYAVKRLLRKYLS